MSKPDRNKSDALHKRKRQGFYKSLAKQDKRAKLDSAPPRVAKSQAGITPGDCGIFGTCVRGRESRGLDELAQLLEEAVQIIYPELCAPAKAHDRIDDLEEDIQNELKSLQESKNDKDQPKFKSLATGTDCVIFLKFDPNLDPTRLTRQIFDSLLTESRPQSRFLQRLIPSPKSCPASLAEVSNLAKEQCGPVFHKDGVKGLKFSVQPRLRLHNKLTRMQVIDAVVAVINETGVGAEGTEGGSSLSTEDSTPAARPSRHSVDLTHPDYIILIEIIKSSCLLCCVPASEYEACRRYNVQMVNEVILKQAGGRDEEGNKGTEGKEATLKAGDDVDEGLHGL